MGRAANKKNSCNISNMELNINLLRKSISRFQGKFVQCPFPHNFYLYLLNSHIRYFTKKMQFIIYYLLSAFIAIVERTLIFAAHSKIYQQNDEQVNMKQLTSKFSKKRQISELNFVSYFCLCPE